MTTPQALSLTHLVRPPKQPAADGTKPPLLVLLHGVGSNENDLVGLAPYLDGRFFVISARAPLTLGVGSHAWYPINWTAQGPVGDEEKAEASRQAILRFLPEAADAYGTDPKRVYLMGFSQGAIMSLYTALTEPEAVTAIVPMSGRLLPEAWAKRALDDRLSGLPVFAVHGTRDTVLPIANGREISDKLSSLPLDLTYTEYDMAHEVSAESLGDITAWLTAQLDK
jgi:phospholipase/carboxylesterase